MLNTPFTVIFCGIETEIGADSTGQFWTENRFDQHLHLRHRTLGDAIAFAAAYSRELTATLYGGEAGHVSDRDRIFNFTDPGFYDEF